jgi:hypothetical protein
MPDATLAPTLQPRWYRHRWPWLLMLGPAIVIVAGVFTAWLAIASEDGLVSDDYYKRGLAINRTIERTARADALGLHAVVDVAANGVAQVTLAAASEATLAETSSVRLTLAHPTRAGHDVQATLARVAPGRYAGSIPAAAAGRWRVIVESDGWRLPAVDVDGVIDGVALGAVAR